MNLPFVLDVAIGLAFIYLILSLLASEIQELLTTLLQWRAAHLKKSIETLLTGGEKTDNDQSVKEIVDSLYSNPLIKNISHESKEGIEATLRGITRSVITIGRKEKDLTLKGNEPSYMPSETFATTLLERLKLTQLAKKMTALNLRRLIKEEILKKLESCIKEADLQLKEATRQNLADDLEKLRPELDAICTDLCAEKATLLTCVNRVRDELSAFIETTKLLAPTNTTEPQGETSMEPQGDPEITKLVSQLKSLKNGIFYQGTPDANNISYNNTDELIRRLQPSLAQILDLMVGEFRDERTKIMSASETYKAMQSQFGDLDKNDELYKAYAEIMEDVQAIGRKLPPSVRESFAALSRRAQINVKRVQGQVQSVEDELYQFKSEVQIWFDRSMDRASGVYKRNSKGVAFLIGFGIALAVNADTLHIVSRLTTDSTLREALAKKAEVTANIECPPPSEGDTVTGAQLKCLRNHVNESIPLPIGRDAVNLKQQTEESEGWFLRPLRMILGWVISGLAIMMGAPFWFELLGKFINVRNSGSRPASTANQTTADQATVNQETSK